MKLRINGEITAPQVVVIDPDGNTREVMLTAEALRLAQGQGLDLVDVDAAAHPPVCKIFREKRSGRSQHPGKVQDSPSSPPCVFSIFE